VIFSTFFSFFQLFSRFRHIKMINGSISEISKADGSRISTVIPKKCHTGEYSKTEYCDDRPAYHTSEYQTKQMKLKDECNFCHEVLEPLVGKPKRCSQCKKVVYCNADCQKRDWSIEVFLFLMFSINIYVASQKGISNLISNC
jgi:hypothetical protein